MLNKKISKNLKKHQPEGNTSKQAAALMSIANLVDAKKTNAEVLKLDGVQRMSTFYGYYILEAMAKAGDYNGALKVIRDYWGGMLDLGATTFWEDFDVLDVANSGRIDTVIPSGKFDIHGDFLCHGWESGPTPWLTQYVLGIHVMDGGKTIKIEPHLGDLKFAKGTFPTKYGIFKVSHVRGADGKIKTSLEVPEGLTVTQ